MQSRHNDSKNVIPTKEREIKTYRTFVKKWLIYGHLWKSNNLIYSKTIIAQNDN